MVAIATVEELASSLQSSLDAATANLLLLTLAEGLVVEEIGAHDPWPASAKAVALAAATRAYSNPEGMRRWQDGAVSREPLATEVGVYLTGEERTRLHRWLARQITSLPAGPSGWFPVAGDWPDSVERPPVYP